MNHPDLVNILDPRNKLMKHFGCLGLVQSFAMHDMVEEFSFFHELHDKEELLGCFDDFVKLYDIGVPDKFEDMYFTGNSFYVCNFCDFIFFEYFDGDGLTCGFVNGRFNLAKSTLTDSFP